MHDLRTRNCNRVRIIFLAVDRIARSNDVQLEAKLCGLRRRQMSEQKDANSQAAPPRAVLSLDPIALKWRNLVDRRRAHLVDLYLSGRWKRYYSEEEFMTCFRDTMNMADRWNEIAPMPDNDNSSAS